MVCLMRALVLHGARDIRIEERPVPVPGPNQLVVKINYSGVCGSDIEFYVGHIPPFLRTPVILGHENAGTVTAVGEGVANFNVGDRLICGPPDFCVEQCPSCKEGRTNICLEAFPGRTAGFSYLDGGYAEYMLINDVAHTTLVKVPDNVDLKDAVLFDVICVAVHAVRLSRFRLGDNVVISGAGSVGLSVIQFLKAAGANKIIVLDVNEANRDIIKQYGGDYFVNPSRCESLSEEIKSIVGTGVGADVVFECAGVPVSHLNCIECVKPGGQVVCVGSINVPIELVSGVFSTREPDFQYSFAYTRKDVSIFMDMLAAEKVSFPGMVTGIFSMEDVASKYMDTDRKGHIKGLLDPSL